MIVVSVRGQVRLVIPYPRCQPQRYTTPTPVHSGFFFSRVHAILGFRDRVHARGCHPGDIAQGPPSLLNLRIPTVHAADSCQGNPAGQFPIVDRRIKVVPISGPLIDVIQEYLDASATLVGL